MPLIVVEGIDGAGKTTLIQNFRQQAKQLCWILARSGPPQGTQDLLETINLLGYGGRHLSIPLIADRHPLISEPIYGPIVRGKSLLEEYYTEESAQGYIASLVDRVIYCKPDLETAQRASRRERQMPGVHEHYWALYQAYDKAMEDLRRRGVLVIEYDWTSPMLEDLNQLFLGAK